MTDPERDHQLGRIADLERRLRRWRLGCLSLLLLPVVLGGLFVRGPGRLRCASQQSGRPVPSSADLADAPGQVVRLPCYTLGLPAVQSGVGPRRGHPCDSVTLA
jgi:hypothetical protein